MAGLTQTKNWRVHNLGRKPEGKRPLCRSRQIWQRKDKICLKELGMVFRSEYKAIPLQAWTGPEGSRKLRLPDFKTIGT